MLSPREREVLALLSEGKSNDEIGAALGISGRTIDAHVSSILLKLRLKNRVQLATYYCRTVAA